MSAGAAVVDAVVRFRLAALEFAEVGDDMVRICRKSLDTLDEKTTRRLF